MPSIVNMYSDVAFGWDKLKRSRVRWFLVAVYMAVIWGLSAQSRLPSLLPYGIRDWMEHFFEFAVLGALVSSAFRSSFSSWSFGRTFAFTFLFGMAYAFIDEIHQKFVPGRCCDIRDWLADTTGASFGAAAYLLWIKKKCGRSINV